MKIAMSVAGIFGLFFAVVGSIVYVIGTRNDDAEKVAFGREVVGIGAFFLKIFFVLFVILVIRVLFSFL